MLAGLMPDESAWDLLKRSRFVGFRTGLAAVDALSPGEAGLGPGSICEVAGAPCSGKSQVMLSLVANTVMEADGADTCAVVVDCDGRFDISVLARIVTAKVQAAGGNVEDDAFGSWLIACMHRVVVYRPISSFQLLTTLMLLKSTVAATARLVYIRTPAMFRWHDKCWEPGGGESLHSHIARAITAIATLRTAMVCMSRPVVASRSNADIAGSVPASWQRLFTHRLRVQAAVDSSMGAGAGSSLFTATLTPGPAMGAGPRPGPSLQCTFSVRDEGVVSIGFEDDYDTVGS